MRIHSTGVVFIGLILAVGFAGFVGSTPASAESSENWLNGTVQKVYSSPEPQYALENLCTGVTGHIKVTGWPGFHEACIYGSSGKTQFARYESSSGRYAYGFSFALDDSFTPLRNLCTDYTVCAYGQEEDVLLVRVQRQQGLALALIKDFTKNLQKIHDQGEFYEYIGDSQPIYVSFGATPAIVNAVAVSANGKWAIAELVSYGLARIDLSDLTYRRITAPGAVYGFGTNPSYELAISNDGSTVARAGWRGAIEVFEASEMCGDELTEQTAINFSEYTYPCKSADIDAQSLFPGFVKASVPRFSSDGTRLSVNVQYGQGVHFVTLSPYADVSSQNPSYAAFGDSFTSGEGETSDEYYHPETNTVHNKCHISSRSYPYLVGTFWGMPTVNKACSGARIADVASTSLKFSSEVPPTELPSHISVSIGGNDIELVGKLKTCLGLDTCEWASVQKRTQGAREIRGIFGSVVDLIQGFKRDYPAAELSIIGYPRVVNISQDATCPAIISNLLNIEERRYMDESIVYVNQVLRAAAQYTGLTYIDVSDAFYNAGLCDQSPRAMNAIRFGDDIAPVSLFSKFKVFGSESFHPTPKGHELVAGAIQRMGSNWRSQASCTCEYSEASLDPPAYWKQGDDAGGLDMRAQRSGEFLSHVNVTTGSPVNIRFPATTFKPGSNVSVELHSEPQELAKLTVQPDGSLESDVILPSNTTGYHTVHVYGVSFAENPIDIYQTISLTEKPEELEESSGGVGIPAVPSPAPIMHINPGISGKIADSQPIVAHKPMALSLAHSEQGAEVLGAAEHIYANEKNQSNISLLPKAASSSKFHIATKNASGGLVLVVVLVGLLVLVSAVYSLIRAVRRNGRYNERI